MSARSDASGPTRVTPEQAELLRPRIGQFRLLFLALATGVAIFASVAVVLSGIGQFTWPPSLLSMIFAGLSVGVAFQAVVLPVVIRRAASAQSPDDLSERISRLAGSWFSSSLVGAALLESGSLMNIVGYIIEPNLLHIALAGLYLAMMWIHFPTMHRLLDWIDSNLSSR